MVFLDDFLLEVVDSLVGELAQSFKRSDEEI